MHRTGWRNYKCAECRRIEKAYVAGEPYCRLKSGKCGATPMEIYFKQMIQHDPSSGNTRAIRRASGFPLLSRCWRAVMAFKRIFDTGNPSREMFENYQREREKLILTIDRPCNTLDLQRLEPDESFCSRVVNSSWFNICSTLLVVSNVMWIGVDAEFNDAETMADADPIYQVAEHLYAFLFLIEVIFRFGAYQSLWVTWRDRWLMFDAFLACLTIVEAWILPLFNFFLGGESEDGGVDGLSLLRVARILRLARLARVARIMQMVPEVMTLLKGMATAMKSVFLALILLLVLLFIFAVLFVSRAADNEVLGGLFPSVPTTMWELLMHGVFLDGIGSVLNTIADESYATSMMYLFFVGFSSFTALNLLIGILCDVVSQVTAHERGEAEVAALKGSLLELLELHDKDDDRHVRKEEFDLLMKNPEVRVMLTRFGVDVTDLVALKEFLFEHRSVDAHGHVIVNDMEKISFGAFTDIVLRLRGGNTATVKDVVELRDYIQQKCDRIEYKADHQADRRSRNAPPGQDPCTARRCTCGARAELDALKKEVHTMCRQLRSGNQVLREQLGSLTDSVRVLQDCREDGRCQSRECPNDGLRAASSSGSLESIAVPCGL